MMLSGMLFIASWWVGALLSIGLAVYLFGFCRKVPVRIFNVIILSLVMIFTGYSSYALLLIRSHANTPMNQQAPDNVFSLASYLNREQYGDRPLFYGATFAEKIEMEEYPEGSGQYYAYVDEYGYPVTSMVDGVLRDENGAPYNDPATSYYKVAKTSEGEPDRYIGKTSKPNYTEMPDLKMLFPRIYRTTPHMWRDTKAGRSTALPTSTRFRPNCVPAGQRKVWLRSTSWLPTCTRRSRP